MTDSVRRGTRIAHIGIAVRALDEVLQLCAAEGLLERSRLPRSEYVPRPELERLLAIE